MAEVLIFVAGALFCLFLLVALLALLPAPSPVVAGVAVPRTRQGQSFTPRAKTQPPARKAADPRLPPPDRTARETYRHAAALTRAEAALRAIAGLAEPAAAKIAAQALRRLQDADAPPRARLSFALSRLELLALRPEAEARRIALGALDGLC